MILTTKGRYAVLAGLYLAKYGEERSIALSEIANLQNISLNYLEQIFAKLRKEGIVISSRGPGGGYRLAKDPEDVNIHNITKAVEEEIKITQCGNNKKKACLPKNVKCMAHHLWNKLESNITDYLESITLSDVVSQLNEEVKTYLDYNATAPVSQESIKAMNDAYRRPLNPSSVHYHGRSAKSLMENARNQIAKFLGIKLGLGEFDICFTASGSEANNLLLNNFSDKQVAISKIEHLSIMEPTLRNPNRILLDVDENGLIDLEQMEDQISKMEKGSLVSIIYANNETGIIQNIKEICTIAHKYDLLVHSDAIQAFGKIPFNMQETGLDFATISSHKIGGPVGAAALIHRQNFHIQPQIMGGGQEKGKRAGTENVAAIVGFGKAVENTSERIKSFEKIEVLRDEMETEIKLHCPGALIFGKGEKRLPNTSMITMPGIDVQTQLIYFDMNGISISSGSACFSGKVKASHVLEASGYGEDITKTAIRVSLGPYTKPEEIQKFLEVWNNLHNKNRKEVA